MGKTWSERLKELREMKGWTQEDMYINTDISLNSIKNWEAYRSTPGIRNRKILNDLFDQAGIQ